MRLGTAGSCALDEIEQTRATLDRGCGNTKLPALARLKCTKEMNT